MPPEAASRVLRLLRWIETNRKDLLTQAGDVSPSLLAAATGKKASYWSDVLRHKESNKSFGDKAARQTESELSMPPMHLEGVGWPFEDVAQDRFDRLTQRQQGRVEKVLLQEIERIEAEQAARLGGASTHKDQRNQGGQKAA